MLVRHGASADSVEGESFELVEGQGDPPLSEIGRHQAEQVAGRLGHELFDGMYVGVFGAPPRRRRRSSTAPGSDAGDRRRTCARCSWANGRAACSGRRRWTATPCSSASSREQRWDVVPGAESREVFGGRLHRAVERIAAAHPGGWVVVFSHGAAIGEILAQASGSTPFAFVNADNTGISRLVVTPERSIVRGYNDTAHLTG